MKLFKLYRIIWNQSIQFKYLEQSDDYCLTKTWPKLKDSGSGIIILAQKKLSGTVPISPAQLNASNADSTSKSLLNKIQ